MPQYIAVLYPGPYWYYTKWVANLITAKLIKYNKAGALKHIAQSVRHKYSNKMEKRQV
ncbi:hypothetical protein GCM10027566_20170 [Arachidicoccus ginsenosidivorans]